MRYRTYGRMTGRTRPVTTTGAEAITATVQTREVALTIRLEGNGDFTLAVHEPELHASHRAGHLLLEGNANEELEELEG